MSGVASIASSLGAIALVAALVPQASPETPPDGGEASCEVSEVEYALAATLQLTDTPLGKGDGAYGIGPGTATLRFDRRRGAASVALIAYRMRESFTIRTTALFWTTTVVTDTTTHVTLDSCASAAEGVLVERTLRWTGPVRGYATDGTITCDGSLCGKFGAPAPGRSELHIAPHPVQFSSFDFSPDEKTFSMSATFVSKTDSPKQTAYVALSGREGRRACVPPPACP